MTLHFSTQLFSTGRWEQVGSSFPPNCIGDQKNISANGSVDFIHTSGNFLESLCGRAVEYIFEKLVLNCGRTERLIYTAVGKLL